MKHKLLLAGSLLSLALSSCYYDPFNTNIAYGQSFSSGGGFGTSVFVSTGDPRWSYDPSLFCYFDRTRGCYYDPFLFGYYPLGYVPIGIRGCPHPYGWSGSGICPSPRSINTRFLSRYDQRLSNYASAEYHWARRVSASGTPRWLGSSERERLSERASAANQPSRVVGWMDGRGLSGQQNSLRQPSSSSFFNNDSRGLSSRSSSIGSPTFRSPSVRETTTRSEPRSAPGGIFGGLDRSRSSSSSSSSSSGSSGLRQSRESSYTPREQSAPRESSSSTMRGSLERSSSSSRSSDDNDSSSSSSSRSSSGFGGGSSERSSGGGGLRSLR